jgi:hypothetical protein
VYLKKFLKKEAKILVETPRKIVTNGLKLEKIPEEGSKNSSRKP